MVELNTQHVGQRQSDIERLHRIAAKRRPDDHLFAGFLPPYYRELPEFDLDERDDDDLYAVAHAHLAVGRARAPGETLVRVLSPDRDRDGWSTDRSIALIVTDDAPFLVDTVRIVLERHAVATHLLVHPMLHVRRDHEGNLTDVVPRSEPGTIVEAWTQVEIDRCEPSRLEAIARDLHSAVDLVHRVVADFVPMRERMLALAYLDPLLRWLGEGHFVFLGAATYDTSPTIVVRPHSTLGQLDSDGDLDPPIDPAAGPVAISRSAERASIHRAARMTVVSVVHDDADGKPVVDRFVGLLASTAYRQSVLTIPSVGDRARAVLGLAAEGAETHTGRSMRNVLETLPRDLVFELDAHALAELVIDVVSMQERQIVRIFDVPEPVGDRSTVLVFVPRQRFHARLPEEIAELVGDAYGSTPMEIDSFLGSSNLARITFTVARSEAGTPDLDHVSVLVDELTTSWFDRFQAAAAHQLGEPAALRLLARVGDTAPESYRSGVGPADAVGDLSRMCEMIDSGATTRTALLRHVDDPEGDWRMRVYRRGAPIALADLLPMLGHVGLRALEERPYGLAVGGEDCFVYDIGVRMPPDIVIDDRRHANIRATFEGLLAGEVEPDGFNRLVLFAGLSMTQANVLRCYARFASQIGFPFSQGYIEDTLMRLPQLTALLVELFEARFDPELDSADRIAALAVADAEVLAALDAVPSLDEDRIGRMFLSMIRATMRTSAYQGKPTISFKFDPALVPDLPAPRPAHEIFVCSARVEGVHLRGGPIARGGLRWSDRPEDYRTEVLGLVKAQMVKNAVIVPVGAKGGFVVKRPKQTPAETREEGVECYRMFVRGLLDLTDNVVAGEVVPPSRTMRYDDDDPYLVVAADKGTATFSDTANEIAEEYGFWLGDAFASGGSAGYDHKAMGITARGAWESVRSHARVLGKDADVDELTVVGIGDMSGDVFGNGMLRSPRIKLIAAFDHRHLFVDPDPDPAVAFAERKRLYDTPRSSWADYDPALISPGGGVFPRAAKWIEVTPQMRRALAIGSDRLTPTELVKAVLRAPVDLLWNGGIGTYVKASTESHSHVGDRTNDAVRIDAADLRVQMVGEGGNLGFTQSGRIEYALAAGLIYTDAIDNSAGVDCSDHEVNIKILLGEVMAAGEMTLKQRNQLLDEMTDEVAELVLANNRAQTLALMVARQQSLPMVNVHARYLDLLEREGWLDRALEFLPSDKQIAERQSTGAGLTTPELAVLIAYTKNANVAEILLSDLPDDPALVEDLVDYFPLVLRERFRDHILDHRLRREIAATELVNQMVNLSGISYDHRMTEDTGASVTDVARAWVAVREVLDFPDWWDEIGALTDVALDHQLELYLDCRRAAERCSLWFLRHRRPPVDIGAEVEHFRGPFQALAAEFSGCLRGGLADAVQSMTATRVAQGIPEGLAARSAVWRLLHTTFDVIELAERVAVTPKEACTAYWSLFDRLELMWLWDGIGALPRSDRWQTQARGSLRDDLLSALSELTENVLESAEGTVDRWWTANARTVQRAVAQLTEIRRTDGFDITNLSVALRQVRNLALTSVRTG
jgi:glutamate dehydrogenase